MSSTKLFLFTRDELGQISDKRTKAIGLSGKTWEEAMRFMITRPIGSLETKKDKNENPIGYKVVWVEQEELEERLGDSLEILDDLKALREDEDFINLFVSMARDLIRNNVSE